MAPTPGSCSRRARRWSRYGSTIRARYLGTRWMRSGVAARAYRLTVFSARPRRREQSSSPTPASSRAWICCHRWRVVSASFPWRNPVAEAQHALWAATSLPAARRTGLARAAIGRLPGSRAAAHPARLAHKLPNRPGTRPELLDVPAANRPPPQHRARAARRSGRRCRRRSTRWRSHDPCATGKTRTAMSRPRAIPTLGGNQAQALPAGSRTTARTCSPSRTVRRCCRSTRPGTCSWKVWRAHSMTEHRIRRTAT